MEQADDKLSIEELERKIAIALNLSLDNASNSLAILRIKSADRFKLQDFNLTTEQVKNAAKKIK